jgi:hypothetical protein
MSLYFKFMTGKSSWVPSCTQGSIPMLFCRWSNVLWLLHPLSVPSYGWWLDQGRWSLRLFFCFCGNDRTMALYQIYRVCCIFELWSFRYLKNLVCNNFKHSDVFMNVVIWMWLWMATAKLITILAVMWCVVWNPSRFHGLPGLYGLKRDSSTMQMVTIRLNLL